MEQNKDGISIIIPAYNEEKAVSKQISSLQNIMDQADHKYEIIAVNDGSTDGTSNELQKFDIIIINSPYNRGYGASLKSGISKATYDYILIIDADGTYKSDYIPEMLDKMKEYDMVVGARIKKDVQIPWNKGIAKWFLRRLASYLAGQEIPDLNSGLRVMKKSIVKNFFHVLPSGFSFTTTITLCMICNGYLVHYLPIGYDKRIGQSKIRSVDAYHFLLLILRTIILFNPLKVFLPFGSIFFMLGLFKLIFFDLPAGDLSETVVMGFLTAFIIWAIGLLSDQIARVGLGNL